MPKGIQRIIELVAERFFPLIGGLLASTVEMFVALGVADQQSQLEEAARQYEEEGKPEIAAELRRRAQLLTSDDPAASALKIARNVSARRALSDLTEPIGGDRLELPAVAPRQVRRRGKKISVLPDTSRD